MSSLHFSQFESSRVSKTRVRVDMSAMLKIHIFSGKGEDVLLKCVSRAKSPTASAMKLSLILFY